MELLVIILSILAIVLIAYIVFIILYSNENTTPIKKEQENLLLKNTEEKLDQQELVQPITELQTLDFEEKVTEEVEDQEEQEVKRIEEDGKTKYIVIKYNKSFVAKLIQSEMDIKKYYSELKNHLLSFDKIKNRMSWKWETYRLGKKTLVKIRLRGKTLSLNLALNPKDYENTKYHVENMKEIFAYSDIPCLYRIKSERRVRYAKDLIDKVMKQNEVFLKDTYEKKNYALEYPYETTEALIERKLIKELTNEAAQSGTKFRPVEIRRSVTAQEVDALMQDEVAEAFVEKTSGKIDKTNIEIINIDTLSKYFQDGEIVTLEELKKRVEGFKKKTTYVKVLARGKLDKKLTVEADSFSIQAIKMIALTGGKILKK